MLKTDLVYGFVIIITKWIWFCYYNKIVRCTWRVMWSWDTSCGVLDCRAPCLDYEDCKVFLLSHDRWWVVHAKYGALKHSFDAALKWCVWLYIWCVNIAKSIVCVETDALLTDILYAAYLKTDLRDWRLRLIYCKLISETEYWDWYVQMLYAVSLLRLRLICANVVCCILCWLI